jgi:flagellar basal-body rod protein FlgG
MGVEIDSVVTDFSPAPMRLTEDPLDFAIDGDGFFGVRMPQGVRYTRNGQFSVSSNGTLVNSLGYEVMSQDGGPIRVPRSGNVSERAIGVFSVPNAAKQGESLFTGTAAGRAAGRVRGGTLEGSGAEPARSMVDMIASFRAYEASQRAIRTIDDTLGKATQQVGTIS